MKDNKAKYPQNVLHDMGYGDEEIECYDYVLIRSLESLICSGIFGKGDRYIIFRFYYREGFDPKEISVRMGMTENHVRRELAKIKHILKKNMLSIRPVKMSQNTGLFDDVAGELDEDYEDLLIEDEELNQILKVEDLG